MTFHIHCTVYTENYTKNDDDDDDDDDDGGGGGDDNDGDGDGDGDGDDGDDDGDGDDDDDGVMMITITKLTLTEMLVRCLFCCSLVVSSWGLAHSEGRILVAPDPSYYEDP